MIVCSSTELGCFKDCILSRVTLEDYTRRVSMMATQNLIPGCVQEWATLQKVVILSIEFQGCAPILGQAHIMPHIWFAREFHALQEWVCSATLPRFGGKNHGVVKMVWLPRQMLACLKQGLLFKC